MSHAHTPSNPQSLPRALALALAGFILWSLGDGVSKIAGQAKIPMVQIVAISSACAALVAFLNVARQGNYKNLWPRCWKFHLVRFGFVMASAFSGLIAFTHLPITTVYVIVFLSPLLLSLCAALFLGERLRKSQITAILAGFLGVVIALQHGNEPLLSGSGFLASGIRENLIGYAATGIFLLCFVVLSLLMRIMGRTETIESITFIPFFGRALCLLPLCFFSFSPMSFPEWIYVCLFGAFTGFGTLFVSTAYKYAPVAMIAPLHYFQILVGAAFGYAVWGDVPTPPVISGASIIIAAGLLIVRIAKKTPVESAV